jgi:hypothetical protein
MNKWRTLKSLKRVSSILKLNIMKKLNLTLIALTLIFALTTSCKKHENGYNLKARTTKEFTAKYGAQKQTIQLDASALPKTITLLGGTQITFPAGSIKQGGTNVTGTVTVEAYEMLKRSAVILSGSNTNHISGAPLVSDGFIFVDVKSGGNSVDQNLSTPIKISIPTNRTGITQLWNGVAADNGAPLAAAQDAQMAWQAPKDGANGQQGREVNAIDNAFTFNFGNLGWINCDVFYSYSNPKTTITVQVDNNPGSFANFRGFNGETFVFFCAKGSNVAAQLYTPDGPNKVKSYDNMMPIGVEGKMLSFSIKDGRYYYAEQEITISASQAVILSLTETTEAQIQNTINSLDTY